MKSLLYFIFDMCCAAVDGALHVFDDEPEDSGQSPTSGVSR